MPTDEQAPGCYEIRVQGRLDARWGTWFEGMTLSDTRDGVTVIQGPVVDQAALHGLLQKLRDLGLPLVSVIPTTGPSHAVVPAPRQTL
ncbi:hypothetical protein [Cellulomonas sp. URHB0016]